MNISMVFYLLGRVLLFEGALLGLPTAVSLYYQEYFATNAFLITIVLCVLLGLLFSYKKPKSNIFYLREGFVITALSWIVISILGALPFLFTNVISNPIDAFFETVSGFTTTGASILSDVETLPKSILFWRSFTHWIGGMGVLVFLLVITPLKGGSNANLMKAESPGPQVEKLVPKTRSTAGILYGIYVALTVLQIILLLCGGMSLFEASTLSFGTAGTGGFGIKNTSIADYSSYIQVVIAIFMILYGINFTFYFLLLCKKVKRALAMEEVRWYLFIILSAILIITWDTIGFYHSFGTAIKHALFQVASIITTTGFATTDFNLWPVVSKTVLVLLMFVGACAGSTGGGIKVSRFVILCKTVGKENSRFLHPSGIRKVMLDKKPVPHEVVRSINVFMITYVLLYSLSILLIGFDNHDLTTNFTAVVATLNNIGPGLELVGPLGNFSIFSNGAKLVLIFDMLAGRLELFPLLLLFNRDTWRKF